MPEKFVTRLWVLCAVLVAALLTSESLKAESGSHSAIAPESSGR